MTISVVIPTLNRGEVLLATLRSLVRLEPRPEEILVVDQTERHDGAVLRELDELEGKGRIRRLTLSPPSIPRAMNLGLAAARGEVVLFVDDDVEPSAGLIAAHLEAHARGEGDVIAGQVLQPGESPEPLEGAGYAFRSSVPQVVDEVIGCNFSVDRGLALGVGGFDELFVGSAYRFEAEFCSRVRAAGGVIFHSPEASLRHLRAGAGGTRSHGEYLTSFSPRHSVGEYYYLLRRRPAGFVRRFFLRPLRSIATRHHLRRPWWIPATVCAETLGIAWAVGLVLREPRLLDTGRSPRGAAH